MKKQKNSGYSRNPQNPENGRYPFLTASSHGVSLKVYIQPGSSKNEIAGFYGSVLKIRLTARPVEGEANRALMEFLAEFFSIRKSQIEIKQGFSSRNKLLNISGVGIRTIERPIEKNL